MDPRRRGPSRRLVSSSRKGRPSERGLGLGAVIAGGAAVAAVIAAGVYFSADTDSPERVNAPPETPRSSETSFAPQPVTADSADPTQPPVASVGELTNERQATSYPAPLVPVTPVAPKSPQDFPATTSAGRPGLPADLAQRVLILQQQVPLRPNDGVNRATLAALLEARGDLDDAEEHYRQAVEDAPNYARGRHDYGIFLGQRRRRLDEARRHLQAAVDLDPNSAQIHVGLGFIHGEGGDMTLAMKQFNRALELDPSHIEAHFYLASALDEVGRLEESAEHYRTVSRLQPGYYAAHYGLGAVLAKQGDFDGALETISADEHLPQRRTSPPRRASDWVPGRSETRDGSGAVTRYARGSHVGPAVRHSRSGADFRIETAGCRPLNPSKVRPARAPSSSCLRQLGLPSQPHGAEYRESHRDPR